MKQHEDDFVSGFVPLRPLRDFVSQTSRAAAPLRISALHPRRRVTPRRAVSIEFHFEEQ
jgi:hypothetical protein